MSTATVRDAGPGLDPGPDADLRDAVHAVLDTDIDRVWQLPDADVADALAALGRARQLLAVAEVALVREGISRGLPTQTSWSVHDWVAVHEGRHAPRPESRHVSAVARVAAVGLRAGSTSSDPEAGGGSDSAPSGVPGVVAAFAAGDLSLGKADQLVRFEAGVRRVADRDLLEQDLGILLGQARDEVVVAGPDGRAPQRVSGLGDKELSAAITMTTRMLRPDRELAEDDARHKASRSLTSHTDACGMTRYKLVLDPEGAAVVDAVVAALSAPVKGPEGEPDDRSPARRRADALLAVVERGASTTEAPTGDKARVVVTISLAALTAHVAQGRCGACGQDLPTDGFGRAGGATATGQVLAPSAVRRLACEGGIIPALLGADSEPLELGRAARFFTPGQKRALYLRDGGCTFPGCTMPAHWSDAHHVQYWSLGGCTDIGNAALLCQRHHTTVHARDLTCRITATGVTWHV